MPIRVPDEGTGREPLCIIGEAPATQEVAQGRPFVGPSGYKLKGWMTEVGLDRADAYWTNVFPYQAPGNKIAKVPAADLAPWLEDLHVRLARLDGPVVIVPTGDVALRALLARRRLTITKARGSILSYTDERGRAHKVIPTIHPAATFHTPSWERRCRLDWRRIASDLLFPCDLRLPRREHVIRPTLPDLYDFLDQASRSDALAIDIETPRQRMSETVPGRPLKRGGLGKPRLRKWLGDPRITCIGYAIDPALSLTIPTTTSYWGEDLPQVWKVIEALHALPQAKVLQNGLFDTFWLAQVGVPVRQYRWDTRWLHHALDPLDTHSLAYMASVDTREPYWKDDAKEGDGEGEWSDLETFWRYCGKDASVTLELANLYRARLAEREALPFYLRMYQALFAPLLRMMLRGLPRDAMAARSVAARLITERAALGARLQEVTGHALQGKTDLSTKKLATYLYGPKPDGLGLPVQRDRASKATTTKEVVVRKLMIQKPNVLGSIYDDVSTPDAVATCAYAGPLILAHRRVSKLTTFLKEGMADDDGRVRTQYGFTETLRLTSGKNPRRTGANLQNVDRALRRVYVAEPGMFFLEVDASQGEDRIVKCLTRSERLIARALAPPWENDEHTRAARVIWPDLPITPERRYLGKRSRHAGNYDLHGLRFSEELLKDGVIVTPEEAQGYIEAVIDRDTPEVRVWQRDTRAEVMRHRCLANSWGMVWDFTWDRLDDDLYRFAYAARPQSELVLLVNQYGLVPLDKWLRRERMTTVLHHQNHDSLLCSTTLDEAYDVAVFLAEGIGKPRTYAGTRLSMPVEVKVGLSWALPLEFKRLPPREEFTERVRLMLKESEP
jgi:uracil-DNA glycosylase family 4